jgi:hypothetical protein
MGAIAMALVVVLTLGTAAYLVGAMIRSISNEKRTHMRLWKNFGLSLGFCTLFVLTWIGHGATQWQSFTDEQREHNEPVELGDFTADFLQSTLENWQSEFLQLFTMVVLTAFLIHKGSTESKDSDEELKMMLHRIERRVVGLEQGGK